MSDITREEFKISWDKYPIIGFSMAIMLALIGVCKDNSYLIIVVLAFFLVTGVKDNLNGFITYIKRFPIMTLTALLYTAYYTVVKTQLDSKWFALAAYLLIFGGYHILQNGKCSIDDIFGQLRIVLMAFVMIDIANIMVDRTIFFGDPVIEVCIIVTAALVTLFFDHASFRSKLISLVLCILLFTLVVKIYPFDIIHFFNFRQIFPLYFEGGMRAKIIGRGQQQAQILVPHLASNTFTTLLFDYGVIALSAYICLLGYVIYKAIKQRNSLVKKMAALIIVVMISSLFSSVIYWNHIAFLLYLEVGIFFGLTAHEETVA